MCIKPLSYHILFNNISFSGNIIKIGNYAFGHLTFDSLRTSVQKFTPLIKLEFKMELTRWTVSLGNGGEFNGIINLLLENNNTIKIDDNIIEPCRRFDLFIIGKILN